MEGEDNDRECVFSGGSTLDPRVFRAWFDESPSGGIVFSFVISSVAPWPLP